MSKENHRMVEITSEMKRQSLILINEFLQIVECCERVDMAYMDALFDSIRYVFEKEGE